MTLLDYLKAEADRTGVSLVRAKERFADRIGVPTITVHHWAYGNRTPLAGSIKKISDATKGVVGFDDFMKGKDDEGQRFKGSRPAQAKV